MKTGTYAMRTTEKLVTVIGGSGFVGRHVVRSLAKRGYRIRVACRRPDLASHVVPMGSPGQIALVQANVRYPASLAAACQDAYAVINLTGVLASGGTQTFDAIHAFGASASAKAAKSVRASVFIQMSALGASADSSSEYARTKATGESAVAKDFNGAIILRPSVIFGPEDNFFNQFATMARFAPALPLIGNGVTKLQPVFVGDVAEAIAKLVDAGEATGRIYELGGPDVMTLKALLEYVLATTGRKRLLVNIPWAAARALASVLQLVPGKLLTTDQIELLKTDNVVSKTAQSQQRTLQGLGLTPRSITSIVPSYLYRFRKAGQFTAPSGMPE